jgi:hypothetical protein
MHGAGGVRQTAMHTAENLCQSLVSLSLRLLLEKMKRYKLRDVDRNPAELIHEGGEKLYSEIHKLIKLIWNKEELPQQWKESIVVPIHKKGDKTNLVIIEVFHCCQLYTKFYQSLLSRLTPYADEIIGNHQYGFLRKRSTPDQIFCIWQILLKKREYNGTEHNYL